MPSQIVYKADSGYYALLEWMTAEKVKSICRSMGLDPAVFKDNEERKAALRNFEWLQLADAPTVTSAKDKNKKLKNFHNFDEKTEDFFAFVELFEEQAKYQEFPISEWPLTFSPFLKGKGATAWSFLTPEQKKNWIQVKECLLQAYDMSPETYRQYFHGWTRGYSQSWVEFGNIMMQNLRRWWRPKAHLLEDADFRSIMEKTVVSTTMRSMTDEELRFKVSQAMSDDSMSLVDIMKMADDYNKHHKYSSLKPPPKSYPSRHNGNGNNHNNGNGRSGPSKQKTEPVCHVCNEIGHIRPNCPKLQTTNQTRGDGNQPSVKPSGNQASATQSSGPSPSGSGKKYRAINRDAEKSETFLEMPSSEGVYLKINLEGHPAWANADSGANVCIIASSEVKKLNVPILETSLNLCAANKTKIHVLGKVILNCEIATENVLHEFYISDLDCPITLGTDLISSVGLALDFGNNTYWSTLTPGPVVIKYPLMHLTESEKVTNQSDIINNCESLSNDINVNQSPHSVNHSNDTELSTDHNPEPKYPDHNLNSTDIPFAEYQSKLNDLLDEYSDVLSESTGGCDRIFHSIETIDDRPVFTKTYVLGPEKQAEAVRQVNEMLEMGIIRPSTSPWNSSPVLTPKQPLHLKLYRFAIDFRKVNSKTISDRYPLPTQQQIMAYISNSTVYSSLDLRSAFWQSFIDPKDCHKTAFSVTGLGHFEFIRLPYGLKNASANFQKLMDLVLAPVVPNCAQVFIDDVLCHSENPEQHLIDLRSILQLFRENNLTANPRKCKFMQTKLPYLGMILDGGTIKLNPLKTQAISDFPRSNDKRSVMRFLGMCAWCGNFISDLATKSEPLNNLKRQDTPFEWTQACEDSFNQLKSDIEDAISLSVPNFDLDLEIHTDASNVGVGAMMCQTSENDQKSILAFTSKTLNKAQRNYSASEKEIFAVVHALEHWRFYVESAKKVIVYTDHQALTWLFKSDVLKGRLARWVLRLQDFQFEVRYKPGLENTIPDCLSRAPISSIGSIIEADKNECYHVTL